MNWLKYGSIISVPLFSVIALSLIKVTKGYSFTRSTISRSILHLENSRTRLVFRLNFVVKSLLDFGFALYALNFFNIKTNSFWFWPWITSALLFGSLAYFVEGTHHRNHKIITYTSGALWILGTIYFAFFVGDFYFKLGTIIVMALVSILTFGASCLKKTNVVLQAMCVILMYGWVISFIVQYL